MEKINNLFSEVASFLEELVKKISKDTNSPQSDTTFCGTTYYAPTQEADLGEDAAIYSCSSKNELSVRISAQNN